MLTKFWLLSGLLFFSLQAFIQSTHAAELPSAGSTIQQIPSLPAPKKSLPEVHIQQSNAPVAPKSNQEKIIVKTLHVTDAHLYSESALIAVSGFMPGSGLTLTDLSAIAKKITDHYHKNGYFLAQAYLPAQEIKDGAVTINVLEGQYGKVTLNNQTNLSSELANSLIKGLNSGDAIAVAPLETRLLLLSDLPGINIKSTLIPGASVGSSDLMIDVTPGQRVSGSIDADNEGSRYTGLNRAGATVNLNDPSGHGDVATLRVFTSGSELSYGRASYQVQLGRAKAGVAYSYMKYALGSDFSSLQANGTAQIESLYGSYPLIRTRDNNLYAQIDYDDKSFQDNIDSTSTFTDKKAGSLMVSLNGGHRDGWGGGGLDNYSLTLTAGKIELQSSAALAIDSITAQTNGHYSKVGLTSSRTQNVTEQTSLYFSINGQWASSNLDVSEKMELGGPYAVRAYPEGEAYSDQGYVMNLEVRGQLPQFLPQVPGQILLVGFVDTGSALANKTPWTLENNRRTLSGTGIGINWMDSANFMVKAYYAYKLGSAMATSAPDSPSRIWIQGVKYF